MNREETAVLIVGAGPVGLILAHLRGRGGVDTLVGGLMGPAASKTEEAR